MDSQQTMNGKQRTSLKGKISPPIESTLLKVGFSYQGNIHTHRRDRVIQTDCGNEDDSFHLVNQRAVDGREPAPGCERKKGSITVLNRPSQISSLRFDKK